MSVNPNGTPASYYYQAGATAYIIEPAGYYSPAGAYSGPAASAPPTPANAGAYIPFTGTTSEAVEIVDAAGAYSGLGASAPALAAAGAYIPVSGTTSAAVEGLNPVGAPAGAYGGALASAPTLAATGAYFPAGATLAAAEIVDPAHATTPAGASAPTADQAAASSVVAASAASALAPNGAPPGYYYQAGATAYVEDPAGTYSLGGATAPTADPGGTHSAAGAGAPTQDAPGTFSSPHALDRLILLYDNVTPLNEVLSFNSETAVANFYGATSPEATLASEFFTTYGSSANLLFARFPGENSRAHLYGANISNLTLAQLQGISGSLSITSQGYNFSASVNLSGATSFANAATIIQTALNANLPVAATTTGSSIAPVSVSFTGTLNGDILDVTSISSGSIQNGAIISGAGITSGSQIYSQEQGTPGGVGVYLLYVAGGTTSSETMTESYGILTVGSTSSGTVKDGELVTGAGVASLTAIESNISGSGAGSTWLVNNAQTVAGETMTMTAAPLSVMYTAVTGATQNRSYFWIQQNGDFLGDSASLTYAGGTAAASLGLTQASGAFDASPGGTGTPLNESAWMNNLVQTESDQFGSFETFWPQLMQAAPEEQDAFEAWAQSTGDFHNYLAANALVGNTPPAGSSAATADAPGSYSLAGASAPTLAQPGYYVPTAGASYETPDAPGYYTPYAGASAEILALPPVISDTEGAQTVAPPLTDTPFGSVTISDPNIAATDSLTIRLSGLGGALADGAGFTGLRTSAPGVYLLSGTAAAITNELDALVFTSAAGPGTTTFTLTDTTSVGTSASDATTTVTVLSTGSGQPVVSVATFLADQSTLDETPGGFDISDTAANVVANLPNLNADSHVAAITVTSGSATLSGGVRVNAPSFSETGSGTSLTIGEALTYTGGFSEAAGDTLALTGGALVLTGANVAFSGGTVNGSNYLVTEGTTAVSGLTIGGTVEWVNTKAVNQSGGNVTVGDNIAADLASLWNEGTYDVLDNSGIGLGASTASWVGDPGLFEKTGGAGTSVIAPAFYEPGTGTVTVASGTLSLSGYANTLAGAITGPGTLQLAGGVSTLSGGGAVTVANLAETGSGTTLIVSENLRYAGAFSQGAGSTLDISSADTLSLSGTASLSGTTEGPAALDLTGGSDSINSGAVVWVGSLSISGSGTSVTLGENLGYAGAFSEAAGDTFVLSGGYLALVGADDSFAGGTVDGSNFLYTEGTTTVSGLTIGGTVEWVNTKAVNQSGGNVTVGDNVPADRAILWNAVGATYDILDNSGIGLGASTASYIDNAGLLEKMGGTATSAIAPAVTNTGTIEVAAGTLNMRGAVAGAGSDKISVASTLEFDSTVAAGQTVSFTGNGGTLDLGAPQGFAGKISGFDTVGANDAIEVASPWVFSGFTENAAGTQGTLAFANGASHLSLTLVGDYNPADFAHQTAANGSTLITYT